jgi:hypothetical protein
MKIKDKKALYISIVMIFFLGIVSFWRIRTFSVSELDFSFPSYEKIEIPNLDEMLSEENLEEIAREIGLAPEEETEIIYKREIIEEKIRVDYPSSWTVANEKEEDLGEKMKVLFVAYADKAIYPSALAVIKVDAKNIEEAVDLFTKEIEKEGKIMNVTTEKVSEEEYFLEISISYLQNLKGSSSNKVFFINNSCYMISVVSFDEKLATPKNIVDYIISSVQIIE